MMNRTWNALCPICLSMTTIDDVLSEDTFFGENFINQHLHPIKRYWYDFKNKTNYSAWLKNAMHNIKYLKTLTKEEQELFIPLLGVPQHKMERT